MSNIDLSTTGLSPQTTGFHITGDGGLFGEAVSSAGDVNKDGYDDLLIGARGKGTYVIYGGEKSSRSNIDISTNALHPFTTGFMFKNDGRERLGWILSAADINNDGNPDFIITDAGNDKVYLVLNQCPKYCELCSSDSICNVCFRGYGLNSLKLCEPCSPAHCETCAAAYTYCDTCSAPYSAQSGQCVIICPDKTFLSNTECLKCPGECTKCTNLSTCQGCIDGYTLTESGGCVLKCPAQTFLSNGECQSCPTGCSSCTSLSTCQGCIDGYMLTESQACKQIICPPQTFPSNGECQSCPTGCSACTGLSTCQSCITGYTMTESHLCKKIIKPTPVEEDIEEKNIEKIAAGAFEGISLVGAALGSGSSLPLNFGIATKILRNIKYMKLPVSRELREVFISWEMPSEWISAPKSWSLKYSSRTIPGVFSRYGLQSAFLINFWKPLVLTLVGIAVFAAFKLVEASMSKKRGLMYTIWKQVNVAASSFALIEFYGNLDDVIFYFILEIRSTKFETIFRICSSVTAIVLLLLGGLFIVLHSLMLGKYQRLKKLSSSVQLEGFVSKFRNLSLIFKDFKDKNSFIQSFLMINIIRSVLSSAIFATLFGYPLIQISAQLALNILMILYLCWKRSFKELFTTLSQIFCEVALLVAHACVFILALSDHNGSDPILSVDALSKCIIIINLVLLFGCAVLLVVSMGKMLFQFYLERRKTQQVLPKETNNNNNTFAPGFDQSNLRLSTNSGLINQSQSIMNSDRNPLTTVTDENEKLENPRQGNYYLGNRIRNKNPTGGFDISNSNLEDVEEENRSAASRLRRLALSRIAQGSKMKDILQNKSPESKIPDPSSINSRMIIHEEDMKQG